MRLHYFLPSYVFSETTLKKHPRLKLYQTLHTLLEQTASLVDRTGTINFPIDIVPYNKFTPSVLKPLPLPELVHKRVLEIKEKANNKAIVLLYSGGIDSTLVFSAFHNQKIPVMLAMSPNSILENIHLYEKVIRPSNYRIIPSFDMEYILRNEKFLVVTGDYGDKINGSSWLLGKLCLRWGDILQAKNYEQVIFSFFKDLIGDKNEAKAIIELLEPLIATCPGGVQTVAGYIWWLDLTLRWDAIQWKLFSLYPSTIFNIHNYVPFFGSDDFVNWSIGQQHVRYPEDAVSNKSKFKSLIKMLLNDNTFWNKAKVGSQCSLFHGLKRVDSIDTKLVARIDTNIEDYLK